MSKKSQKFKFEESKSENGTVSKGHKGTAKTPKKVSPPKGGTGVKKITKRKSLEE